ncbi:hypothetical protein [Proteus terrae]|uniref:hypothetical protein n=1 Tax=Proteus terrae TaxID=1574161 RepID=UPI000D69E6F8|nr:hypothetical protein [Proteus terrae]
MKISFNDLVKSLYVNHKKENTTFLLSNEITKCLNTLNKDHFFILEGKGKDKGKNIYIDKGFFHKMENDLIDVIKYYTKDNSDRLAKVFLANDIHKVNSPFICKNKESFSFSNLDSLDNVRGFISKLIEKTKSTNIKNSIFNKDECPTINIFFKKNFIFANAEVKSLSKIIKELGNKTRELNVGCELPYQLDNQNNILLVKFGNLKAADYNVKPYNDPYQNSDSYSIKNNWLEKIKNIITEFEIHFNFLNENIRQYHEIVDNSCFFERVKKVNDVFNFVDSNLIENIKKHYKCDDLHSYNNELVTSFNEINNNVNKLNSFYKENIFNAADDAIGSLDINELECKLKEVKSNTDLLKIKIEPLSKLSTCICQYNNEFKNKLYYLEKNSKKIVCDSIMKTKEKINECLSLLDEFIKRKETGFLSKVYKFFFPEKHNKSLSLLIGYKSKINNISTYIENYQERDKYLSINNIGLIVTSNLSKINYPDSLLGYLYGEKRKCDNFIQSLFKNDE